MSFKLKLTIPKAPTLKEREEFLNFDRFKLTKSIYVLRVMS